MSLVAVGFICGIGASPAAHAVNLLVDPGFEAPIVGTGFDGNPRPQDWLGFSNSFGVGDVARNGSQSMLLLGGFSGSPAFSGFLQDVAVSAGDLLEASIWTLHDTSKLNGQGNPDVIAGTPNQLRLVIEFFDAGGGNILNDDGDPATNNPSALIADGLDPGLPLDVWYQTTLTGVVTPTNAVSARFLVLMEQQDFAGGLTFHDDAFFTIVPEPAAAVALTLAALAIARRRTHPV